MKQLFTLLAICSFIPAAFGQYQNTIISHGKPYKLSQFYLLGNVKTITESNFDKSGTDYEPSGVDTRTFDQSGKLTEVKTQMQFMGQSMGTIIETYSYDAKGRPIKTVMSMSGKSDDTIAFFYDAKGKLVSMETTSGGKTTKEKYEFDVKNRLIAEKYFDAGASSHSTVSNYTYDEMDRITMEKYENIASREKLTRTYTYKDKNRQPASYFYDDGTKSNTSGVLYNYTGTGELAESKPADAKVPGGVQATTIRYEYDSHGNWTKATRTGFGEGYTTRKIEYYPVSQKPEDVYKKSIIELSEPTLKSFGVLIKSAVDKTSPSSTLLQDEEKMISLTRANIEKLKKIPALEGNNSKALTILMMEFIISAPALSKLESVIKQTGDYTANYRALATDLVKLRKEIMAEFAKIK